mgnify:FL=1
MVEYPKAILDEFKDRNSYSFDTMPGSFVDAMMEEPRFPPSARFRQAKWVTHESGIPWLKLDVPEFDWNACYNEAMAVYDEAIQHRKNDYDENNPDDYGHRGWRSLTLHGLGKHVSQHWDSKDVAAAGFVYADEREARAAYHWTEIADKCPETVKMIKSIPGYRTFDRVRYMYLEPGGYITPHTDYEHNKLGPLNISLNNPENCHFKMIDDNAYVPWKPGNMFKMNVGHRHAVMNDTDEVRVHMIVHGQYGGSDFEDLILKSWAKTTK